MQVVGLCNSITGKEKIIGQFTPTTKLDGLSSLYFASSNRSLNNPDQRNPSQTAHLPPATTTVWTKEETGEIIEIDIELNDIDFHFFSRADPPASVAAFSQTLWIEDVVAHEIGHAFGLEDSGVFGSTMFRDQFAKKGSISCDDDSGIHSAYNDLPVGHTSQLVGTVVDSNGQAVLAAEVLAISATHGLVLGSSLSDHRGTFHISSLYPDDYLILVQPIIGTKDSRSEFFAEFDHHICPYEQYFSRTFLHKSVNSHILQRISLGAGEISTPTRIQLRCTPDSGVSIGPRYGGESPQDAPMINPESSPVFSLVDQIPDDELPGEFYYRIHISSDSLTLHLLSYTLHSPLETSIELIGPNEGVIAKSNDLLEQNGEDLPAKSLSIRLIGLAPGDYLLHVHANIATDHPEVPPAYWDRGGFFVLSGTTDPNPLPAQPCLNNVLPTTAQYQSPNGPPRRREDAASKEHSGGCFTHRDLTEPRPFLAIGLMAMIRLQRLSFRIKQTVKH